MYINDALQLIAALYQRQIETGKRFSVELQAGPGIGKSEGVRELTELPEDTRDKVTSIPKTLGLETFGFKPFFLSTLEQPDVRGFGLPSKDSDGTPIMTFTSAPWMPRAGEPKNGIIFLDEFRQAGHDVQKPAAELLLNGSVGDSKLPIEWMVVAASNREKDRSGVQRELAFISNRRMLINIDPNLPAWVEWAERPGNDIHWAAIAFAKNSPGDVFKDEIPVEPGPFCTPRSLVQASYLIGQLPDAMMTEACVGLLGEGTGAKFMAFLRVAESLPDFDDIVKKPDTAPVPDEDRPDAQYATMQMVAHRADKDTAAPAFTYLQRMPREFQVSGLQSVLRKTPEIVQSKGFTDWLRKNKDLVASANLLEK